MGRVDRYGDKGPKADREVLARGAAVGGRTTIGCTRELNRADGTAATYVETVAGPRLVRDSAKGGR
jgi:hypothetical protein